MSKQDMVDDMVTLYQKYGFFDKPMNMQMLKFRVSLLAEEYVETSKAFVEKNPEEFVDGMIDMLVIIIGTLELAGVDTKSAWDEVFRANFAKERGVKDTRPESGGFDLIKPRDWKAPDHNDNHGDLDALFAPRT